MSSSAIVVLVPEAEHLVDALRARHDPAAALGVPAHVTVLFPFVSPVNDDTIRRVAEIASRHAPFATTFGTVERFPGLVVWLRPEPSEPFSALIDGFVAEFPDWPPYGGAVAEPIPHLTVADGVDADTAAALEAELESGLPLTSRVTELTLLVGDDAQRWTLARTWPLGGRGAQRRSSRH
jgi:2'-5' RNA ligase superfamily